MLIILGATLGVMSYSAQRVAGAAIDRGLSQTNDIVRERLRAREQGLSNGARVFAQQSTFVAAMNKAVAEEDFASVLDQATEAVEQTNADWVQITSPKGILLAKSNEPTAEPIDLGESALIGGALEGEEVHGFGVEQDSLLIQAIAVPIGSPQSGRIEGALMAARYADDSLARAVHTATNGEVLFYAVRGDGSPHIVATSPGISRGRELEAFIASVASSDTSSDGVDPAASAPDERTTPVREEVELGGTHYVGQRSPLMSAGGALVGGFIALRNRDVELAAFTRQRNAILLAGGIGLLVAFVLSWVIARQISRPVTSLAIAARRAADGDYSTDIKTRSRDEVGMLAGAFNALLADLREKQALVEFMSASRDAQKTVPLAAAGATRQAAALSAGIEPGKTFANRYEIRSILGVGGMGMVYRAIDRELGETVAIKTLKPDMIAQDASALDRFKEEIRLARRISHRNVVRTHDLGESGGLYYITMELVEGTSLKDLIRSKGRLPVPVTLTVGKQLARALEVAHEQGVIHRDIKPQNIVVEPDGVIKVMDFGIARLAQRKEGMTQAGMVVGTPEYMSPEQLLGDDLDGRTDIYAAGVVLYECLTGNTPFVADSPITLIAKVLEEDPAPPRTINADVPARLSDLVLRAMSRERDSRPRSAAVLHAELAAVE